MSKKNYANVGGQAVMEGIMMRSPIRCVLAVRDTKGEIVTENLQAKSIKDKYKFFSLPFVRGIISFVESMAVGYKALMRSAEISGFDEEEVSKKESNFAIALAMVIGVVLAVGLFIALPLFIMWLLELAFSMTFPKVVSSLIMGVLRIAIALSYILIVAQMKDIKRMFEYHGAEHKTIFCFENRQELTVDNVKVQSRIHPRCGTNFIMIVLVISLVFYFVVSALPVFENINNILFTFIKLLFIPIIAGISFEILRFAGRYDNIFTKVMTAPGRAFQKITTREPSDDEIEVAIVSLKTALTNPETGEIDTAAAYR